MIVWVIVRRLLALVIRLLLINRIVTLAVFGVLIVGVIATQLVAPGQSSIQPTTRAASAATANALQSEVASGEAPAPAVESYLKGMTSFQAQPMWDAMSPGILQQMQGQGVSIDKLQAQLDQSKSSGVRYDAVSYIGGYPLKDGTHYFFYVVSRQGINGPNSTDQVYYVFTTGPDGKILSIE